MPFVNNECTDDAREFVCGKSRERCSKFAQSLDVARPIGGNTMVSKGEVVGHSGTVYGAKCERQPEQSHETSGSG